MNFEDDINNEPGSPVAKRKLADLTKDEISLILALRDISHNQCSTKPALIELAKNKVNLSTDERNTLEIHNNSSGCLEQLYVKYKTATKLRWEIEERTGRVIKYRPSGANAISKLIAYCQIQNIPLPVKCANMYRS